MQYISTGDGHRKSLRRVVKDQTVWHQIDKRLPFITPQKAKNPKQFGVLWPSKEKRKRLRFQCLRWPVTPPPPVMLEYFHVAHELIVTLPTCLQDLLFSAA
ncbi:hypothetical protein [Pseudomonas lundensis]|uniref:hypothetical protein n=1 Tax=Pseudomonas lundensis TaxID=86185 RepID=UPI0014740498|nr:hypothetical protein [Pseudomonas lundensis]NNA01091.1 hypothetical protein [Pseudomonas lundensis]